MDFLVALTDTYRKTYRNCTKAEQKDIDNAVDEWKNNPDSKGSNFEKLGFMGDNIFSIRISRGGRIIMAKFDGTYFLLHVDPNQHDKANDWARNKKIDRNITTGAIQIYSTDVEEIEVSFRKESVESTEKGVFEEYSDEDLLILGVPETWLKAVRKISNEDQVLKLSESLPEDAWSYISSLFEGSIEKEILIAQLKSEIENKPDTVEEQLKVQPGIHVVSDFQELVDILNQDISVFRLYMHPTQRAYAFGDFTGPQKLTGSAGTGKTVVAINRAKYLVEQLEDEAKPLFFTTYTNALVENIKATFKSEQIPENRLYVSTIHSFALKYGKRLEVFPEKVSMLISDLKVNEFWIQFLAAHPHHQGYSPQFLREEYEQVIQQFFITSEEEYLKVARRGRGEGIRGEERKKLWKIITDFQAWQEYKHTYSFADIIFKLTVYLRQWPEFRPFSHIVCDEIQDFDNNEMRLLRHLVEEGRNDLFLCGDPFQNIYKRRLRFIDSGINIRGNRSSKLKVNYRTTEEIRKKAISVIEDFIFEDFSGVPATFQGDVSIVTGNSPVVHLFKTHQLFHDFLIAYIKDSFGTIGLHELCICNRTDSGLKSVEEALSLGRIPYIRLGKNNISDLHEIRDKVVLATMHSIKGLEFKNLIVTGFDNRSFPYKPKGFNLWTEEEQREHLKSEHALHYVAFSRAISNLIITGVGKEPVTVESGFVS